MSSTAKPFSHFTIIIYTLNEFKYSSACNSIGFNFLALKKVQASLIYSSACMDWCTDIGFLVVHIIQFTIIKLFMFLAKRSKMIIRDI